MSVAGIAQGPHVIVTAVLLLSTVVFTAAADADSESIWDPILELLTVCPRFELKTSAVGAQISSGNISTNNAQEQAADNYGGLRERYLLKSENLFVDVGLKGGLGMLGFRINYEPREFAANRAGPDLFSSEARLSYSGVRIGFDLNVPLLVGGLGLDLDYDCFRPTFTYPSPNRRLARNVLTGPNAFTMGTHAFLQMPAVKSSGSPEDGLSFKPTMVAEARVRWPITGTEVLDWGISAGIETAYTKFGSLFVSIGHRNTELRFKDGPVDARFDGTISGWFVSIGYRLLILPPM